MGENLSKFTRPKDVITGRLGVEIVAPLFSRNPDSEVKRQINQDYFFSESVIKNDGDLAEIEKLKQQLEEMAA